MASGGFCRIVGRLGPLYQDVQGEGDEVVLLVGEELAVNFGVGQIWPDQQGGGCG